MGLLDRVKRVKNREFMEAVAAACAMVASADGLVRPEEAAKVIDYAQIDETLAVFDYYEVMETFEAYVRRFEFDYNVGRQKAFEAIRKLVGRPEQARLLVLVSMAVADADGDFDNNQRLAVRDICRVAGLNLKEFDLDLRAPSPRDLPPETTAPRRREPPPEWMRDPAKAIERAEAHRRLREGTGSPAGGREKPERPKPDPSIPEWMRNPPDISPPRSGAPSSSPSPPPDQKKKAADESLPEWMRNPPDIAPASEPKPSDAPRSPGKKAKPDDSLPEWMRNPPDIAPSSKSRPSDAPRDSGKKAKPDDSLPEWMRNPRTFPRSEARRPPLPDPPSGTRRRRTNPCRTGCETHPEIRSMETSIGLRKMEGKRKKILPIRRIGGYRVLVDGTRVSIPVGSMLRCVAAPNRIHHHVLQNKNQSTQFITDKPGIRLK
jgi:tellurite resistance protein TerB